MTARRTDANQAAIVAALRQAGRLVQDTHTIGGGCPDILVGTPAPSRRLVWLEIKRPGGKLNGREFAWHYHWHGYPAFVVHSAEEALEVTQ